MADPKTRPWLRPFVIALLVVVAPAVLYWFIYAERRVDAWERQAWQVLDGIGAELQAAFNSKSEIEKAKTDAGQTPERTPVDPARIDDLIPLGSRGDFDGIAILDAATGALLAQSGKDEMARLPAQDAVEFWGADGTRLHLVDHKLVPIESASGKPEIDEAHKPSASVSTLLGLDRRPRVEIGGESYAAFLTPVHIGIPKNIAPDPEKPTIDYAVVGLVSATHLHGHALRLSPIALVWIAALVTGAFLVLPFVKIRFMGRRERLRSLDMWMLAGSAFLGTGMVTLLLLQLDAYSRLLNTMDDDLQRFTRIARRNVELELEAAFRQLNNSVPTLASESMGRIEVGVGDFRSFPNYPHFRVLFLTDQHHQIAKWITTGPPTPLVGLDDKTWTWFPSALRLTGPQRYLVDLTLAKKTIGVDLAIVASPVRVRDRDHVLVGTDIPVADRTGVAAIATELVSIKDAVLPKSFRFAVIRPDGVVALRSAEAPNRGTNFFVEAPDMQSLVKAAAVERFDAALPDPSDYRYRGTMQRAIATPLWNAPPGSQAPVLVAFYDKEPVEQLAATLVINASSWLIALVIACLVAAALARVANPLALDLAWPERKRAPLYGVASIALVLFAVAMLGSKALPEWTLPYLVIGAPALGLVTLALVAARMSPASDEGTAPTPPFYPAGYIAFVMIGLLAIVAAPVCLVFRDSAASHRAAFEESIRIDQEQATRQAIAESRANPWTSYPFDLGSKTGSVGAPPVPESWCRGLLHFDAQHLPRTHFSLALDACLPAALRDPILASSPLAAVDAEDVAPRADAGLAKTTAIWIGLATLGALALLGWFVSEVGTKILGLRLEGDGVVDGSARMAGRLTGRSLLLRPPASRLEAAIAAVGVRKEDVIDLGDESASARLDSLKKDPARAALITGLEWRLDAQDWRKKILELLEQERSGALVLVAAVDPLYYLQHRGRELEGDSKVAEGEIEAWSRALADICKIRFEQPTPKFADAPHDADPRLADWVRDECSWDDRLVEIGNGLLARTDLASFNEDDVIEYVLDEAEAHYRSLWSLCCVGERLVLVQLAQEGFVNPRCFDRLRRLRRRRLIRVDPRFRLMNQSFRRFALEIEERETVLGWEREGAAESSARVRGPLIALGFVAAALLLLTQGQAITDALAYASATGSLVATAATVAMRARALGTHPS